MVKAKIFSNTTVNTLISTKKIILFLFLFLSLLVNDCILMYLEIIILYIYNSLILYGCLFGVFFFLYTPALASLKSWVCPYFKAFINFSFFKFRKSCYLHHLPCGKKRKGFLLVILLCFVWLEWVITGQWWLYMQARVVIGSPWLAKNCIYTLTKKILYAKLTYCDHPNKNYEHPDLRITQIWVQKKIRIM